MRWEMDAAEVEAVLERIWDLHDKVSDAIHAVSRAHFLTSINTKRHPGGSGGDDGRVGGGGGGFVFVKDFGRAEDDAVVMAEASSLNAIRTALENLEDQLEFFHTVQSQQRAERDAAIARLEQSRIILAMRLADHQGRKYKVIEEALAFVGDSRNMGHFVAPENLYGMPRFRSGEDLEDQVGKRLNIVMRVFISSLELAKNSFKFERIGGVLGNAALFAVSMFALLQLQQIAYKCETPQIEHQTYYKMRNKKNVSQPENSQSTELKNFDVFSARG